jgi:tRNA threonylcarbamoyladenosine biosynthesis protein TsaB
LIQEAGITLQACDALAFGRGPGSFTGVRTACGLAQGLAFGADIPVVPVVSLLAMAHAARRAGAGDNIVSILDARMGEVYWAQYRFQEQWKVVITPTLSKPAVLKPELNSESILHTCGNGLVAYAEDFTQLADAPRHTAIAPHATDVAQLAVTALAHGQVLHARDAQPLYLRNKVALTTLERLVGVAV